MKYFIFLILLSISALCFAEEKQVSLKDSISLALKNNYELKKSRLNVLSATYQWQEAKGHRMPRIDLELQGTFHDKPDSMVDAFTVGTPPNSFTVGPFEAIEGQNHTLRLMMSIKQPLYTGGKIVNNEKAAHYQKENHVAMLTQAKQSLIFQTLVAYYNAVRALNSFDVENKILTLSKKNLEDIVTKYEAKAVSKYELIRAESDVLEAEGAYNEAKRDYEVAKISLAKILHSSDELTPSDKLNFKKIEVDKNASIEKALKNRFDLMGIEYLVSAAEKQKKIIAADGKPQISVFAGGGVQNPELGDGGGAADFREIYHVGILFQWNIFDGSRRKNKQSQIEVEQLKFKAEKELLKEKIKEDIKKTIVQINQSQTLVEIAKKALEKSGEVYNLVLIGYANKRNTQLEVLDARLQMSRNFRDLVNATYYHQTACAQLVYLEGGMTEDWVSALKE